MRQPLQSLCVSGFIVKQMLKFRIHDSVVLVKFAFYIKSRRSKPLPYLQIIPCAIMPTTCNVSMAVYLQATLKSSGEKAELPGWLCIDIILLSALFFNSLSAYLPISTRLLVPVLNGNN